MVRRAITVVLLAVAVVCLVHRAVDGKSFRCKNLNQQKGEPGECFENAPCSCECGEECGPPSAEFAPCSCGCGCRVPETPPTEPEECKEAPAGSVEDDDEGSEEEPSKEQDDGGNAATEPLPAEPDAKVEDDDEDLEQEPLKEQDESGNAAMEPLPADAEAKVEDDDEASEEEPVKEQDDGGNAATEPLSAETDANALLVVREDQMIMYMCSMVAQRPGLVSEPPDNGQVPDLPPEGAITLNPKDTSTPPGEDKNSTPGEDKNSTPGEGTSSSSGTDSAAVNGDGSDSVASPVRPTRGPRVPVFSPGPRGSPVAVVTREPGGSVVPVVTPGPDGSPVPVFSPGARGSPSQVFTSGPDGSPIPVLSPGPLMSAAPAPAGDSSEEDEVDGTGDGGAECFPAQAMVSLEDGSRKRMDELVIGDMILTTYGQYSRIFTFTHRVRAVGRKVSYLTLHTTSGAAVTMTPGHYLYVNGKLAAAYTVSVGDDLELADGRASGVVRISQPKTDDGLYNPQTVTGTAIVDGVRVSCYTTSVSPVFAHAALTPLRALGFAWFVGGFFDQGSWLASVLPSGVGVVQ